jgi:diadenylate cyclase
MLTWYWEALRKSDVLDIALMAFLFYRLLIVIRGTRAIQTLAGLAALIILYVLATRLGLDGVSFLLDRFFVYIVLAVIILFQQDIRRALATAGGRLFPEIRPRGELVMVDDLVRASFALASRHIGALVAIERKASLDEYTQSGTQLDAVVSQDLLQSIFHPTSPLHDGAVIIQKGRLSAAQAFLPLSQSKELSRLLGTRHRAAIGLTEETDAVVIIVSEERGTVSVVRNGHLTPTSDANELRARLGDLFGQAPAEPRTEARTP